MSFLFNWWSGKKEEENNEDKDKVEEKEEKNEIEKIEEKGETEENIEKEKGESEDKNEKKQYEKSSSLTGFAYELDEEEEENKDKDTKDKQNENEDKMNNKILDINLEQKEDGTNSIKININLGDNKESEKKILAEDLSINKDDPLHWKGMVYGPENTPYEKGKFGVSINFEENNPNERPKIQFLTKIYHYNVEQNNGYLLCPYIWNKDSSDEDNLKKIKLLMSIPDSRYPFSKFIQEEYYNNFPKYKEKALRFTEDYAMN